MRAVHETGGTPGGPREVLSAPNRQHACSELDFLTNMDRSCAVMILSEVEQACNSGAQGGGAYCR